MAVVTAAVAALAAGIIAGQGAPAACNLNATTGTFAAQVAASTAGQTICLASGSYGTFAGTNKAVTIRAATGATATMTVDFTTGDSGFTLDGLSAMSGDIAGTTNHITIRNSSFTDRLLITDVTDSQILLDHDDFTRQAPVSGDPAMVHLAYNSQTPSGVTVQNSLFHDSDADGIQAGTGLTVLNNEFARILENGPNHTDAVQLIDAPGSVVRGNWIHSTADGIVAYDGISHALIEDNVVDLVNGRWGIELYADNASVVRHNTLVERSSCTATACGKVDVTNKAAAPVSVGTELYDNLTAGINVDAGQQVARNDHNPTSTGAVYVGATSPTSWAGYCLAPSSPTGRAAASDGLDAGIRC